MVHNLGKDNSLVNQYVSEIRDELIQKDPLRFRRNVQRLGEIFAYEISKELEYENKEVITSLGSAEVAVMKNQPVLATILRAGLALHDGLLQFFDRSPSGFISAYRKHDSDGSFEIKVEYSSCPVIEDEVLILSDPMLATGSSMVLAYKELLRYGKPKHTHIVSLLSSIQGVEYVKKHLKRGSFTLWTAAIDEELTAQAYIVPGLGDAGDLAYGSKD